METVKNDRTDPLGPSKPTFIVFEWRTVALLASALAALTAIVLVWTARVKSSTAVYVSQMGAPGEPSAGAFAVALVCVGVAPLLLLTDRRVLQPRTGLFAVVPVWMVLTAISASFLTAAGAPCSPGCPLPFAAGAAIQDLIHTISAVIGFGAAGVLMLQVAASAVATVLRRLSKFALILTAVFALGGASMSLLRINLALGGYFEFVATSIALSWFVGLALVLALPSSGRSRSTQNSRFSATDADYGS